MAAEVVKVFETWIRFEKVNLRDLDRIQRNPACQRLQRNGWFWLRPWPAGSLLIAPKKTDGLDEIKLAIQTSLYANVKTITKSTFIPQGIEQPGVGVLNDLTGRFEVSLAGKIIRQRTYAAQAAMSKLREVPTFKEPYLAKKEEIEAEIKALFP